jgi:hypothetical protein
MPDMVQFHDEFISPMEIHVYSSTRRALCKMHYKIQGLIICNAVHVIMPTQILTTFPHATISKNYDPIHS